MKFLERGLDWLAGKLPGVAPAQGTLVYRRAANGATVDLTGKAWVGRTLFLAAAGTDGVRRPVSGDDGDTRAVWSDRDYLVRAADLPFAPEPGDRFEETLAGGVLTVYEVLPYAGEPEWRYSDPLKRVLRVHTKQRKA